MKTAAFPSSWMAHVDLVHSLMPPTEWSSTTPVVLSRYLPQVQATFFTCSVKFCG